jgi:hypothetical protein
MKSYVFADYAISPSLLSYFTPFNIESYPWYRTILLVAYEDSLMANGHSSSRLFSSIYADKNIDNFGR